MPELPEVETICRKIRPKVLNEEIGSLILKRPDLRFPIPKEIIRIVKGASVDDVYRRSKYLIFKLNNDYSMFFHLGMSGRLFFTEKKANLNKHDHVLINFKNGLHLRFRDPRRFGVLDIEKTAVLNDHKLFKNLGVEPLTDEFSFSQIYNVIHKSQSSIKNLIMNAKNVVGVGNIYASEALFLSGIRPTRKGCRLTRVEVETLVQSIKQVLLASIESGGTSFRDYVDSEGQPGLHKIYLNVYGREAEPCLVCDKLIKKVVQSQRSSYYCSACQK